jgi:ATP-dependent DNA helicase RecQ
VVPAGTLVRISLAHPWRPQDRPQDELRCFLQISGWSLEETTKVAHPSAATYAVTPHQDLKHREEVRVDEAHLALAKQKLRSIFGFDSFHPLQAEVIARVLTGRDTLVVMPTGGGKSLCYQLPALLLDGLTLVITPLVALMHDQVRQLAKLKIPAACLNHTVSHRDWTAITDQVRDGRIQLLYLAPETMLRPEILVLLEQSRLACVAVDEAHCLSEWGHDFRPEFRQLPQLRKRFPGAVCLGLTATATERVRQDIGQVLQIPRDGQLVARFNRENLFLAARKRFKSGISQIVPFVEAQSGNAGIIYCGTRKQADQLSAGLNEYGIPSVPYHAGMEDEVRHENQAKFTKGEVPLIVATVAFGMGINKPDVRFVIHAHLPHDLESYYQEIGRAGRDGLPAHCLLLYSWADVIVHRHFIEQGAQNQRSGRFSRLTALTRFAESAGCRRVPLLSYFGERFAGGCNACDRCVEVLPACYEEREIPNLVTPRRRRRAQRKDTGTKPSRREKAVVCMFEEGRSIEEVAGHFQVKPKRVLQYLESHAATGGHLDAERILGESTLEPELRDTALEVFRRIGFKRLSPVHRALHEAVTFDDLRLLRLYLMAQPQALTHSSR